LVAVADVARLHQEDHVLRDVGGVVGDALQVAADQDGGGGGLDGGGGGHHVGQQDAEGRVLEAVHLGVGGEHLPGQRGVAPHEAVQAVPGHALGDLGHAGQVDDRLEGRVGQHPDRVLRDVDRLVADALEVGVDLHGGGDEAEVGGHRLLQG